ncbi:hypothetical protein [Spartinivicinus ruber]|uniref:hypothetical protein n=1 Tax=Spartinivicinus ruber TaxID=2683272 RepID=UPI0013D751A6|nr:hypothetical protein [Spartinivicinus ruber]
MTKKDKKVILVVAVLVMFVYIFRGLKEDFEFWLTKGIPENYIQVNNIWITETDLKIYGIDTENNLLTIKGKKPSNWYVRAYSEWHSGDRKCLVRKDWTDNPTMIPSRYMQVYYGIDKGDSYIITIPQQVNNDINKCSDYISEISFGFYSKNNGGGGNNVKYYPRSIPLSKKNRGYPASPRKHYCKEGKSDYFNDKYVLRCERDIPEGHDGYQVYHDEIKPYTIELDFYVDESWF